MSIERKEIITGNYIHVVHKGILALHIEILLEAQEGEESVKIYRAANTKDLFYPKLHRIINDCVYKEPE